MKKNILFPRKYLIKMVYVQKKKKIYRKFELERIVSRVVTEFVVSEQPG